MLTKKRQFLISNVKHFVQLYKLLYNTNKKYNKKLDTKRPRGLKQALLLIN